MELSKKSGFYLLGVAFSVVLVSLLFPVIVHAATSPSLGVTDNFSVLAGTAVTNIPTSVIQRNVGLSPAAGSNYSGLTALEVGGLIYAVDGTGPAGSVNDPGLLLTALADTAAAYGALGSQTCDVTYAGTQDLVGLSLVPGVYCANAFELTGTLTLNGDANDVWIFKSASSLVTTGTTPNIVFTGGAQACNVWWRVVSTATFDADSSFAGNVLADTSITFASGVTLTGRALARTAAVTLSETTINSPICVPGLPRTDIISGLSPVTVNTTLIVLALSAVFSGIIIILIAKNKNKLFFGLSD